MNTARNSLIITAMILGGCLQASSSGVGKCLNFKTNELNTKSCCVQCYGSGIVGRFSDFSSNCEGATPIANCMITEIDSTDRIYCNSCSIGYYATSLENSKLSACSKIPPENDHCIVGAMIASTFYCISCDEGFSLEAGKCVQAKHDANCRYNGHKGYCIICKEGFALATNSNICEITPFAGCSRFDKIKNICNACDFMGGYYVSQLERRNNGDLHQVCSKNNAFISLLGNDGIIT